MDNFKMPPPDHHQRPIAGHGGGSYYSGPYIQEHIVELLERKIAMLQKRCAKLAKGDIAKLQASLAKGKQQ